METKYVELRNISKSFGPVKANEGVSLTVRKGSIHAIVGENGAGKSTAMKMLYGQYHPDSGEIWVAGKPRHWGSSADAIRAGIGMVHQHFTLAATHGALDNILIGQQRFPFGRLRKEEARARLQKIMSTYGLKVDLDRPVGELPVGLQQRVEILKVLFQESDVLILDEPTAVLAPAEIDGLFRILREMAAAGKTILVITHKLKEVLALAERATIFRAGKVVGDQPLSGVSVKALAAAMMGREQSGDLGARAATGTEVVLAAKDLVPRRSSPLQKMAFEIRSGEILGIAAVEGNGQTELLRLLLNPRGELGSGSLRYLGEEIGRRTSRYLRSQAIGLFPEDRLKEGMLLEASLAENFLLGHQRCAEFTRGPFLLWDRVRAAAAAALKEFDVRPPLLDLLAGNLSGGNQQKLVVARELRRLPRLLVAAQPTRGVDIGAIEMIHKRIIATRNQGAAVLLVSSELDEVLALADRILVLFRGEIAGSFHRSEFDEKQIGALMAGFGKEPA